MLPIEREFQLAGIAVDILDLKYELARTNEDIDVSIKCPANIARKLERKYLKLGYDVNIVYLGKKSRTDIPYSQITIKMF